MKTLPAIFLSLCAFAAFADQQDEQQDNDVPKAFVLPADTSAGKCVPTPGLNHADRYPGKKEIITKNNLALTTGKAVYAKGQLIHISGRVMDKNCVPVSDAVIDIWQTDREGKYVTTTLSERINPYPLFTGSGRAVTDNTGHFSFTTVFPGVEYTALDSRLTPKASRDKAGNPAHVNAPNINFRISKPRFNTLDTKIFFEHDARNRYDVLFTSVSPWWQNQIVARVTLPDDPVEGIRVEKDFILDGKNAYKKY